MRKFSALWILIVVFVATGASVAVHQQWPFDNRVNWNQPDSVAVFMANGVFDPGDTEYVAPTAEDFDREIMQRDDDEIEQRRQEAVDYFLERFGVDFSDADIAQDGAIILLHVYQDPRWNYRCYKLPCRYVPRSGYVVHDAQYVMAVVAPNATFYGSWGGEEGTEVPGGSVAVNGEYLIQGSRRFRPGSRRNMHIRFVSVSPIFNAASGDIKFDCLLTDSPWGLGAAIGRQESNVLSDGTVQIAIQNVLQFPPPEWALE
jgi:hypothetical protein